MFTIFRSETMIEGCKDHIMSYLTAVADCHTPMVLKMAAGIDKHAFPYSDVLAEIRIEWGKDT